jgi:hypothetical protein
MKTKPPLTPEIRRELRRLQFRLAATRARLVATRIGAGIATAASLLLGIFAVEMTLDWLLHLPWLARASFSLPALAGAAWLLYREVLLPLVRMPSDHSVACAIERAMPVFQTRLIASIQLGRARDPRHGALVGALIRETAAIAAGADFRKAVKTAGLFRALQLLVAVIFLSGGLAALARREHANVRLLLDRALLLTTRLPSRTQIDKIDCPTQIAAGEDLNIDVQAGGLIPPSGLLVADSGSASSQYKLLPVAPGRFHAVIHSVPRSLTLRVLLGDTQSDPLIVTVLSPPVVLEVRCNDFYPAYTGLSPILRLPGDLSLLAGSTLHLTVTASSPIRQATIHLAGLEKDLPMAIDPANKLQPRGEIPIPKEGLTGFSLRLVDEHGIASRDPAVYRIDIVPDRPPTVRITQPPPEELATPAAVELIAFHAEDDFGVAKLLLHYIVNGAAEKVTEFDLAGATPRRLDRRFDWNLSSLKLAPGAIIDYWMEAIDANNVTGPGSGVTDRARIKIVTDDEKRAELSARMNDALDSLGGVSQSEDDLSKSLGARIFQKAEAKQP